jgi:hypothetical protein
MYNNKFGLKGRWDVWEVELAVADDGLKTADDVRPDRDNRRDIRDSAALTYIWMGSHDPGA